MRHSDGSPHQSGIPVRRVLTQPGQVFAPMRAVVLSVRRVGDTNNNFGVGVECDVVLYADRRLLFGVPVLTGGGLRDVAIWEPSPTTQNMQTGDALSFESTDDGPVWTYPPSLKDLDGDHVVVQFIDGQASQPIITGPLPHPRSLRTPRATDTAIAADLHPAALDGHASYEETNGAKVIRDRRGNVVVDTRGAGIDNAGEAIAGSEPKGTIYLQARSGERVVVSIGGTVKAVVDGSGVVLTGGTLGVARDTDPVEVNPLDAEANATWATWFSKAHTVLVALDSTMVLPVVPLVGAISGASTTVKAGD